MIKMNKSRSLAASVVLAACVIAGAGTLTVHADTPGDPVIVTGPEGKRVNDRAESIAKCPQGTRVVGGGYNVTRSAYQNSPRIALVNILGNHPLDDGSGWKITAYDGDVVAYAMCAQP
ncbi:hypothetical protein ACFXKS_09955 [Streptomyces scopuliridis]|uniref:hypothetical protein n=1 Tax=Streptomyces scopuliridis TaxID=452529 RepID=UPI0036A65BB7